MTPGRLTQIQCPECHKTSWIIDSDYRGMDGVFLPYADRLYACPGCGRSGAGWTLKRQSPPEFFLQPHDMYPMTHDAFDYWVSILRANFPDHPHLASLGRSFFPRTPEEVAAAQEAFERAHPVLEMRDQDGARRKDPEMRHAAEWLEIMKPGDSLSFLRRDGGELQIRRPVDETFSVRCTDAPNHVVTEAGALDGDTVLSAINRYLDGDLTACVTQVRRGVC